MPLAKPIGPVIAVIQARMSSTRLPGKVMKGIAGRPILWHVVNRLKASRYLDDIVVATTDHASDDIIEEWCKLNGIKTKNQLKPTGMVYMTPKWNFVIPLTGG